jgi:hypothetical protein
MTADFASWFSRQLLEACTQPLLVLLKKTPSKPLALAAAATAPLSLLVETPLVITSISGIEMQLSLLSPPP